MALLVSVRKGPPERMLETKYRCTGNPAVTVRAILIPRSRMSVAISLSLSLSPSCFFCFLFSLPYLVTFLWARREEHSFCLTCLCGLILFNRIFDRFGFGYFDFFHLVFYFASVRIFETRPNLE